MPLHEFYAANLRSELFIASTVSGVLLILATPFISLLLFRDIYATPLYTERARLAKQLNDKINQYGSLYRFCRLCTNAGWLLLLSGAVQLTIGLIPNMYASLAALSYAVTAAAMFAAALFNMEINFYFWLKLMNDPKESDEGEPGDG